MPASQLNIEIKLLFVDWSCDISFFFFFLLSYVDADSNRAYSINRKELFDLRSVGDKSTIVLAISGFRLKRKRL